MDQSNLLAPADSAVAVCRVTYRMTDQMGIVYYANYLEMFEMGRTQLMKAGGQAYTQLEADGYLLAVIHAACNYVTPARYDDVLKIRTWVDRISRARIHFAYEILREADGERIATGLTHHIYMSREGKPQRLDHEWMGRLEKMVELGNEEGTTDDAS